MCGWETVVVIGGPGGLGTLPPMAIAVAVAEQSGCKKSELIHSGSVVPIEKIINCSTIGISSGASAPEVLVKNFIEQIKKEVSVEIEEVEIVKENVIFKTPGKLN